MKLVFDSLDALLSELRERHVEVVRISPAIEADRGARTAGVPQLVSRVIVSAAIDEHHWAEWRYWVGRAIADVGPRGLHLPVTLRTKSDQVLAEISKRVDDAGFQSREGILMHDAGVLESFRLKARR